MNSQALLVYLYFFARLSFGFLFSSFFFFFWSGQTNVLDVPGQMQAHRKQNTPPHCTTQLGIKRSKSLRMVYVECTFR